MKTLYIIGGTMGVGKTTVCQLLKHQLDRAVFLDGDWCWDAHPFAVTEETKAMVLDNICHLLNNFLACSAYEHVIFCWVLHQQEILDTLLARLNTAGCRVEVVSLVCGEAALRRRLQRDVEAGLRQPDVIERSVARLPLYDSLRTRKLDVSSLTPPQVAAEILRLAGEGDGACAEPPASGILNTL